MSTITVMRPCDCGMCEPKMGSEMEVEVEVTCRVYPGELERRDCPGCPPSCEFESATLNGEPFELTADEKEEAERIYMEDLLDACGMC